MFLFSFQFDRGALNGTFQLLLVLIFFSLAFTFRECNRGGMKWGTFKLRLILGEYGVVLSLVFSTIAGSIPNWSGSEPFSGVPVRVDISPSDWGNPGLSLGAAVAAMVDLPITFVLAALIPSLLLTILFYIDQNLSTLMAIRNVGPLKAKPAFNRDFALLGLTVLATGLLGLPPSSGLIPQNPMHR